jgi:aryl-alcohol dehydrogenase-like predicted oxidoreductase
LHELGVSGLVVVVTKVLPLTPVELADEQLAEKAIERSLEESRRRLRLDVLPIVLFHRESDAVHLPALLRLRGKGLLRFAGVSCDNRPGPAAGFVANGGASALQLPANVLDRRHLRCGLLAETEGQGVGVFIRSVYLQGLLVMPEESIPPTLSVVIPVRRRLAELAEVHGMTLAELAVRYMLSQPGVTCVLAGVDTVAQVRENVSLFNRGTLSDDILAGIDEVVPDLPEAILTPSQWPSLGRA